LYGRLLRSSFIIETMKHRSELLKDIAEVRFGVHPKADQTGNIPVVQVKDIIDGTFKPTNVVRMNETGLRCRDFLRNGDVLFSGKGRITAAIWKENENVAVASNSFFVIDVSKEIVIPEYIAAYLSGETVRKDLGRKAKSSTVLHLSIEEVRNLRIPIPSISDQRTYVRMAELIREEKRISNEIMNKKKIILNNLLSNERQ
jgi:type I restriction enzyme, S subunit